MNVSVNWIRELVPDLREDADSIARRFSMVAAAVAGVEPVGSDLDDIVVARVLEVRPHPNADRLRLCKVDAGGPEPVDVVCGAPVIVEGALYPYVSVGSTLPAGFTIETRNIRGETSHGMLCSEIELALGRDRSGILRLSDDLEPGTPLLEALGLPDTRLDLDLNPNRVDLACHMGFAREFAAPGVPLVERDFGGPSWSPAWVDDGAQASAAGLTVRIEASDRCSRYMAAVIRGVKVGPSPAWLVGRLLAVGARPINNVVDATNYVLLERNQPLHAFDMETLAGPEVRVRAATPAETLTTLDGEERALGPTDTVVADLDRPIALAGVMGGADTEVTDDTVNLLVECAAFDPLSVRKTARSLGVSTDASYRFERGIDIHAQEAALVRCVELILATAGGEAEGEAIRVGPPPDPVPEIELRPARVKQVLGLDLTDEQLGALLVPIGFEMRPEADGDERSADRRLQMTVPGWRRDVTREIDLVEEVARRFGYDEFPHEERRFRSSAVPDDPAFARSDRTRRLLTGRGLFEARSLSFVPADHMGNRASVAIPNPLSAEESFLRSAMVPVLLRRLEHNFSRGRRDVRLFEIGTVFNLASDPVEPADERSRGIEKYEEEQRVGILMSGSRAPVHWSGPARDFDVWDLKALATEIAQRLCGGVLDSIPAEGDACASRLGGAWMGVQRFRILREDVTVGVAGSVRPASVDAPPWAGDIWAIEFDLAAVEPLPTATYRPLSTYPGVRRDLAITVPMSVPASRVEEAIREAASELLESVRLFDVYEGGEVGRGRRSLAWAFRFRADDRTLKDQDVEAEIKAVSEALEERFDARIRTS